MIPMRTRSSDVRALALAQCHGAWAIKHTFPDIAKDATYFEMGNLIHSGIKLAIVHDLDVGNVVPLIRDKISLWQRGQQGPVIETKARPNTAELGVIAERHIRQWFKTVHPSSPDRLDVYNDYSWPPKVETVHHRDVGTKYPIWGTIDAMFDHKNGSDLLLVDWKSSTRSQQPLQLNFYRFLLDRPDAQAGYHYMDRVRRPSIFQPIGDYPGDAVMRRHVEVTERVKAGINLGQISFKPSPLCKVCPVQDGCPKRGDPSESWDRKRRLQAAFKPPTQRRYWAA